MSRFDKSIPAGTRYRVAPATVAAMVAMAATLVLQAGPASAASFSNATAISVPLPQPPAGCPFPSGCPSEAASPFPSQIVVSGLSGTVTDVNVVLRELVYPLKPADADVLLVAPDGKAVMLMSDACGDNSGPNENAITSPITLTFDDSAGALLPADGRCTTGTFRPIDDDDDADEFGLHGHADDAIPGGPMPPAITLPLSTFNGIGPNGTWSLYLVDDYPNDPNPNGTAGRIGGGWTLEITTTGPAATTTTAAPTTTTTAAPGITTTTTPATTTTTAGQAVTTTTLAGTTTTVAAGSSTTTVAPSAVTTTTVAVLSGTPLAGSGGGQAGATTTTTEPLAWTGGESWRMSAVAAYLMALGLLVLHAARERRRRKAEIYVVHFGR